MRAALLCCAALLTACAGIVRDEDATRVPTGRVSAFEWPAAGTVPVTFKRDTGLQGAACAILVFVDGARAVDLRPGELAVLHVPVGPHVLSATRQGGPCSGGNIVELTAEMRPGYPAKYRAGITGLGRVEFAPTAF